MVLEQIEKELGLLVALREAVNFRYLVYQQRKKELEVAIEELADVATQVKQMSQKKEQVMKELTALREEQDRTDRELDSIVPYVELLSNIRVIKNEIAERQKKFQKKEDTLVAQAKAASINPNDDIVQDRLGLDQAIFRIEKAGEDLILQRLNENLIQYSQRLDDTGVNVKEVEKQAQAVRGKLRKIMKTITDKAQNLTDMDKFVQTNQEKVDRLGELKADLSKHETDLANLTEVARLVSEVPFDVQPVPAEHTS